LGDAITIAVVEDNAGNPALRLVCDRTAVRFLASNHAPESAQIEVDDDWKQRTRDRPLVICLHGLKSEPSKFDEFRTFLRGSGYATATFRYDDYQSIRTSASQLSGMVQSLFGDTRTPKVALVGHSMGGLIAREWTENPQLENGRISYLITVGTPHRGSNWACMPPLLEMFTERTFDVSQVIDVILHQPSSPGMRELVPDSAFLRELNARPRRADVRYTNIVGTYSVLTPQQVEKIHEALNRLKESSTTLQLLQTRVRPLLESFDELARGRGDGVVAVQRATMEGVADVVLVNVSHGNFFLPPRGEQTQPVWDIILQRLQ